MKYDIQFTNQFKKDLKLAKKQNKNLDKLFEVIDILANGGTLEAKVIIMAFRNTFLTVPMWQSSSSRIREHWKISKTSIIGSTSRKK